MICSCSRSSASPQPRIASRKRCASSPSSGYAMQMRSCEAVLSRSVPFLKKHRSSIDGTQRGSLPLQSSGNSPRYCAQDAFCLLVQRVKRNALRIGVCRIVAEPPRRPKPPQHIRLQRPLQRMILPRPCGARQRKRVGRIKTDVKQPLQRLGAFLARLISIIEYQRQIYFPSGNRSIAS